MVIPKKVLLDRLLPASKEMQTMLATPLKLEFGKRDLHWALPPH